MKKRLYALLTAAAVVFSAMPIYALETVETAEAPKAAYTSYEEIFQGDRVIDVYVTIAEEDWASILESPLEKDYKSVSVVFDGVTLENVGFSTKGNSTLRTVASSDSDRYSFRFKFNKFDKGQSLLGLDKVSLNNNMTDASYLREYLHYEALSLTELPTPLTTYANLYINGELYALYTCVENVEDAFLNRNFGEGFEDGVLYDTEERATLQYEENEAYEAYTYDKGTEDGKATLKNFIKVLNAMPEGEKGDIETVLDVDSALIITAANTVFGNYDSYNGSLAHNYKLYGDATGKFTVLPWDYNMSFDGFTQGGGAITVAIEEPVSGTTMDAAPMIKNLLAVEEYYEKYLSYIKLFTEYLETVEVRANELADIIRPHVEADPSKFYTMEEFESNLTDNEEYWSGGMGGGFGGQRPDIGDGERPEMPGGMERSMEGFQPPSGSGSFQPAQMDAPPQGGMDWGERGERARPDGERPEMPGGMGGGMMNASDSLVTFANLRLANLKEQLNME